MPSQEAWGSPSRSVTSHAAGGKQGLQGRGYRDAEEGGRWERQEEGLVLAAQAWLTVEPRGDRTWPRPGQWEAVDTNEEPSYWKPQWGECWEAHGWIRGH